MANTPRAISVQRLATAPIDHITLEYRQAYKRRVLMHSDQGLAFLLDLPKATQLKDGDDLILDDGRHIRVRAAQEALLKISAADATNFLRIIWHIGNRHCPCAIYPDHILIEPDHVIAAMVEALGGETEQVIDYFTPEGGAYGTGRIHGHKH